MGQVDGSELGVREKVEEEGVHQAAGAGEDGAAAAAAPEDGDVGLLAGVEMDFDLGV